MCPQVHIYRLPLQILRVNNNTVIIILINFFTIIIPFTFHNNENNSSIEKCNQSIVFSIEILYRLRSL